MNRYYPHLFTPAVIRGKRIKNRLFAMPTLPSQVDSDGIMTDTYFENYVARAKGGFAVVTVGETAMDQERSKTHDNQINIWTPAAVLRLADLADHIHRNGALAAVQLCHGGIWSMPEFCNGKNPYGPSACIRQDGVQVEEMTEYDMDFVADEFARAASIFKKAGFDIIQVHAAHGWLLSSFLSPYNNQRTDKYGGSLENRARFPLKVLEKVRDAIGNDTLLDCRFSAVDSLTPAVTIEESAEFLKMAEGLLDFASPSRGNRMAIADRSLMFPNMFNGYGSNLFISKQLKELGVKTPIIAMGGMQNPAAVESTLAEGICDFVGEGKGTIADPQFANKCRTGRGDEVRPCLRCSRCADLANGRENNDLSFKFNLASTHRLNCAVNPEAGRWHYRPQAAVPSRNVVIVGGGPAGMQAAISATEKGHKVTLFEKSDKLGGQLKFSETVSFKHLVKEFKDWQIHMVEKLGVDVRLNTEPTAEMINELNPDKVIVAVGAKPLVPPIPGIDNSKVMFALDSFDRADEIGQKVVVIGGGQVGCETGLHIAMNGGKDVTVVEMGPIVAPDCIFTSRVTLVEYMDKHLTALTNARCTAITDEGVKVMTAEGEKLLEADTVVIAAGMKPLFDEAMAFDSMPIEAEIHPVGDCLKARDIFHATSTAYDAVMQIS